MKKIADFIKSKRYVLIWTACYAVMTWAVLQGLFGFPMFSAAAWDKLMHAHLHGFAGFTFGILILAAVPLYVATTAIIMRTGKPLFDIKVPEKVRKLYAPPPPPKATEEAPAPEKTKPETYEMPSHLPTELHGAFLRARSHTLHAPATAFSTPQVSTTTTPAIPKPVAATSSGAPATPAPAPAGELPLPTDFDFDASDDFNADGFSMDAIPTFSDITFDDDAPAASEATPDKSPAAPDTPDAPDTSSDTPCPVLEFLTSHGRSATRHDDLVICDDMIIATHDDPDFWIADDETWFANGKSRPSPIAALIAAAAEGLRPVLYLGTRNILDIDTKIAEWTSAGIRVIENLDDLI